MFFHTLHTNRFPLCSYLAEFPFTCQGAKIAFAAYAVPYEKRVRRAAVSKLHVDELRAKPHLQVAELHDWVAVPLLQPIRELACAGRKRREASERAENELSRWDGLNGLLDLWHLDVWLPEQHFKMCLLKPKFTQYNHGNNSHNTSFFMVEGKECPEQGESVPKV